MPKKKAACDYSTWPVISTFDALEEIMWLVVSKQVRFAIIQAGAGIGKTATRDRVVERALQMGMKPPKVVGEGTASGRGLYALLVEHPDSPIIADDFDVPMEEDRSVRSLVRALTDTCEGPRTVRWQKQVHDVPQSVSVTATLLLVVNELDLAMKGMRAIISRAAIKVRFIPGVRRLQERGAEWATIREVFSFWSHCLPFMSEPNLRSLSHAEALHRSDAKLHDWRQPVLGEVDDLSPAQKLLLVEWLSGRHKNRLRLFHDFVQPSPGIDVSKSTIYTWIERFEEAWRTQIDPGMEVRGGLTREEDAAVPPVNRWKSGSFQDSTASEEDGPANAEDLVDDALRDAIDEVFRNQEGDDDTVVDT